MMNDTPYEPLEPSELTLRDYLAIDRTALANERTYLAYVRTALALIIFGATLLGFLREPVFQVAAVVSLVLGLLVLLWGTHRFLQERRRLARLRAVYRERASPPDSPGPLTR